MGRRVLKAAMKVRFNLGNLLGVDLEGVTKHLLEFLCNTWLLGRI